MQVFIFIEITASCDIQIRQQISNKLQIELVPLETDTLPYLAF